MLPRPIQASCGAIVSVGLRFSAIKVGVGAECKTGLTVKPISRPVQVDGDCLSMTSPTLLTYAHGGARLRNSESRMPNLLLLEVLPYRYDGLLTNSSLTLGLKLSRQVLLINNQFTGFQHGQLGLQRCNNSDLGKE